MNPLRLLVVTDRFWPVVDPEALAAEEIGHALAERGHIVQILTCSGQKYWSPHLRIGELTVSRIPYCSTSRLGKLRLVRQTNQWLEARHETFDLMIARPMDELCGPAIHFSARHQLPACLWQCSTPDLSHWSMRVTRQIHSWGLDVSPIQWIMAHVAQVDLLRRLGIESSRLSLIEPGIDCRGDSPLTRTVARAALAENHRMLSVDFSEPLVISPAFCDLPAGTLELLEAWRLVRKSYPRGRLWLLGDAPPSSEIWARLRNIGLENEVVAVGWFDNWNDISRAADLLVLPNANLAPPYPALVAMRDGLPILVAKGGPAPSWSRDGDLALEYMPGDPRRLAHRIKEILEHAGYREAVAASAKKYVRAQHDLANVVRQFESLAASLIQRREKVRS
jgi:glycosyltransferase involved in cell wall biosynthesis